MSKTKKTSKTIDSADNSSDLIEAKSFVSGDSSDTNSGLIFKSQFIDGGLGDIGQQWAKVNLTNSNVINRHISLNFVLPEGFSSSGIQQIVDAINKNETIPLTESASVVDSKVNKSSLPVSKKTSSSVTKRSKKL
jgi:hypothetical protein